MRVFVSSPYRGDVLAHMQQAGEYAMAILKAGHTPVVPHYAFNYLDGRDYGDIIALYLCLREVETCDEVWAFGPYSEGMRLEVTYARGLGKRVQDGFDAAGLKHRKDEATCPTSKQPRPYIRKCSTPPFEF